MVLHDLYVYFRAKLTKAECLAMLGRCQEAQEIANDSLRFNSLDAEAIYVRGLCLYFEVGTLLMLYNLY